MPATAVSYTPRPYVRSQEPYGLPYAPRGNTLAELLRLRGTDAARFASRGGDISAQMWQNLAGQISDAGQSLSQYYTERPQREAQARATEQEEEYRRLKNEEAQVTLDANERELEIGTGLELLFSPSQWRSRGDKPPTTQQLIDVAGPERGMAIANAWQALQTPEDTPEDVRKVALGLQAAPEELRRLLWPSLRARFTRSLQLNPADVPEAYDADFLALAANYGQDEQTPPTRTVQTVDESGNPVTRIVPDVPGTSYPQPAPAGPGTRSVQTVDDDGNLVTRIVPDVPGTSYPSPPVADKPPTQSQFVTGGYASRMVQAGAIFDEIEDEIVGMNPEMFKFQEWLDRPASQSQAVQSYMQAAKNWINASLRRESGAAIGEDEFKSARKQYLFVPGDTEQTKADKRANRELQQRNFIAEAGSAYEAPPPRPRFGESRISTVEMRTPDGRTIFVPLDKVEEALSRQAVIVGGR